MRKRYKVTCRDCGRIFYCSRACQEGTFLDRLSCTCDPCWVKELGQKPDEECQYEDDPIIEWIRRKGVPKA